MQRQLCYSSVFALTLCMQVHALKANISSLTKQEPVFIESENIDYDYKNELVTAWGAVEIVKGQNVLFADKISYNRKLDKIYASGQVALSDNNGNVTFADKIELGGDLKQAIASDFKLKLQDGSKLAANKVERINENKASLDQASYTPCKICKGQNYPLWQIKADKVSLDNVEQKISYDNAYFEVFGVPVFYMPYFSHPTPDADNKSGFLLPEITSSKNFGTAFKVPYLFSFSNSHDLTLAPIFTTQDGPILSGGYRYLFPQGEIELSGSIKRSDKIDSQGNELDERETRGHIEGEGHLNLTNNTVVGFDAARASDATYLERYKFSYDDTLTARGYIERIDERDYTTIQALAFQTLGSRFNQDYIPYALPYTSSHFESRSGILGLEGSKISADINNFIIQRDLGEQNKRATIKSNVHIPYTFAGNLVELNANIFAGYYQLDGSDIDDELILKPELNFNWSYPIYKPLQGGGKIYLEPIVAAFISDNNNDNLVNEDSQDIEYNHINIFDSSNAPGVDLQEYGSRVSYGLRVGYYDKDITATTTIGQKYYVKQDNGFVGDKDSEIVGNVSAKIYNSLKLDYNFSVDNELAEFNKNSVKASVDISPLKISANYLYLNDNYLFNRDIEEATLHGKLQVTDEWFVHSYATRNLADSQMVNYGGGIGYNGDCVSVIGSVRREFVSDRDIKAGVSYDVRVGLKNLSDL